MKKIITIIILIIITLTSYIFLRGSSSAVDENFNFCAPFKILFLDIADIFSDEQKQSQLNSLAINNANEIIKSSSTKFNNQKEYEEYVFRLAQLDFVNILHDMCLKTAMEVSLELRFNTNDEMNDFIMRTYQNCILCNNLSMFKYILPSIQ